MESVCLGHATDEYHGLSGTINAQHLVVTSIRRLLVAHPEEKVSIRKFGVYVEGSVKLLDGLISAACEQQTPGNVRIDVY
jgi:hypothetical protein